MSRVKWFATDAGRRAVALGSAAAACLSYTAYLAPQSYLKNKTQEYIQLYKYGVPVPVAEKVELLAEQVMDDLKLTNLQKRMTKFFTVYGFDVYSIGTLQLKTGVTIGLPHSFSYDNIQDVERREIIAFNKPVPWDSDEGAVFQRSLVLSNEAQKFVIARELCMAKSLMFHFQSFYTPGCILGVYASTFHLNRYFNAFAKPLGFRSLVYSIVYIFGFGLWCALRDKTTQMYENAADRETCDLGPSYTRGGIEFYSRLLQRNIALRDLAGDPNLYTAMGNQSSLIRQKHVPLTLRREYAEARLKVWREFRQEC